ncbi:hypothetical protein BDN72DRAFT_386562 [Pluteus cervinus]|uniref:Uncharacterized protein n=1 Tax=Pluteus cervinus TaxID=181527 RepID=A0ACD3AA11_9AGAR|nr:hypothetical protein BDN72DRAFT_386562 [Pluteus cervinus]
MVAGSATVFGIVMLENARIIDSAKPRSVTFDAYVFTEDTHPDTPAQALLHYYNANDLQFGDIQPYFIIAHVAQIPTNATLPHIADGLTAKNYIFAGDITLLIPAGAGVVPENHLYVQIAGAVTNRQGNQFSLSPEQYVGILPRQVTFPTRCEIRPSKRWGTTPPQPRTGSCVVVGGYLERVVRDEGLNVVRFEVDTSQLVFLGKSPMAPTSPQTPSPLNGNGKRSRFTYRESPCNKRPRLDDSDDSGSSPGSAGAAAATSSP